MPSIRPQVQKLHHFVRQPQWIAPPVGDELKNYTEDEISKFQSDPAYHRNVRRQTERKLNGYFASLIRGSEMQNIAREQLTALMKMQLQGHEQTQSLIPDFPWGCRRPTPGIGYLEALRDPKVEPVIGNIKQVTEKGLETEDGKFYPLDVLICATGFDTSYLPHFPIIGDQGKSLAEQWKDEVQGYLGISVPHFPNYFSLLGPNCPVGNGPILIAVEQQASYITQMLSKFQKENARSFAVSAKATKDVNAWKDNYMDYTVWTNGCRSWYQDRKNGNRISALWPGSTLHYIEAIQAPRYEDWQWDYQPGSNPWSFLGNGFSSAEGRGGELGWYISSWDGSPIDPCLKQEAKL